MLWSRISVKEKRAYDVILGWLIVADGSSKDTTGADATYLERTCNHLIQDQGPVSDC